MRQDSVRRIAYGLAGGAILALLLVVLLPGGARAQAVFPLYVSPAGDGTLCQPDSPCALTTALDRAVDGCAIYLAEGAYTGAGEAVIVLTKSLTLYGGWDGTEAGAGSRDPAAHPAVIDGEGTRRGVIVGEGLTVTLDGFTVANGVADGFGAGLYSRGANLTLQEMGFTRNAVAGSADYAHGGGAFVEGGTLRVDGASFLENSADGVQFPMGGGLAISATVAATVTDSLFQDNDAWSGSGLSFRGAPDRPPLFVGSSRFVGGGHGRSVGSAYGGYGGGMTIWSANARVEDSSFADNRVLNSAAVDVSGADLVFARSTITGTVAGGALCIAAMNRSTITVTNSLFAGNAGWREGVSCISAFGSHAELLHDTIVGDGRDTGVFLELEATATVRNTILVSHTVGVIAAVNEFAAGGVTVTMTSTVTLAGTLWGDGVWANGTDIGGEGVISSTNDLHADPGFVAPEAGDYHLAATSAAVDAGVPAGVRDDLDGEPRPWGCPPDIGAYEAPTECAYYELPLPLVVRR